MVCHSALRSSHTLVFVLAISLQFAAAGSCLSQALPNNSLARDYEQARKAYASKQFQQSAELFHSVADRCKGSELAIQCEYFALISEWSQGPSESIATKFDAWLDDAQKLKSETLKAGRNVDNKLIDQWTASSSLMLAKWERQKLKLREAEKRLRSHVEAALTDKRDAPDAWLELGSILLEQKQDLDYANECFENALSCCKDSEPITCKALWGQSLVCWNTHQYESCKQALDTLLQHALDDDLAIQAKLLSWNVSKALGETLDAAKELQPIVELALASNPQVSVLYDLAIALLDAKQNSNSDEVLLAIVHRFPETPISIEARVRLARSACNTSKWADAVQWCDQAINRSCPTEFVPHLRLMRGQANLELGQLDSAKADLELALGNSSSDVELQVAVRFYLAETLYQFEKWDQAHEHWTWLLEIAKTTLDPSANRDWVPTVLLRTAEMLALKKEWKQAEEIVLRIRNDFPKCNRACEVDYLLARCLVSKAEFDAARQVLGSITHSPQSTPPELLARAHWMAGETYLMQRKFAEAQQSYQQVLLIPEQKYWHSAALLQIGQCCESTQDSQAARAAYEQIENQFADSPFAPIAIERRKLLPSVKTAKQPEQDSLGKKR